MDHPENLQYELSPQLVDTDISSETVILDYEKGKYFGLEGVGSFVWGIIKRESPVSLQQLVSRVTAAYRVDETRCKEDLQSLLADLKKNGLIITSVT